MPTFSLGPSSSAPSQSDGGSNTNGVNPQLLEVEGNSRAGTRFIILSRGCGRADPRPVSSRPGGRGGCVRPGPCCRIPVSRYPIPASSCRQKSTQKRPFDFRLLSLTSGTGETVLPSQKAAAEFHFTAGPMGKRNCLLLMCGHRYVDHLLRISWQTQLRGCRLVPVRNMQV